ncbi:hypothetical protein POM88_001672 [Heracleum sosnowskyi]|uniref:Uncharacterized protein n=1 Tax=Heracleum sosnowskyi TaxID=360622 RepID=A0AAD8JCZ9_9APIA|nr:hypothetical protein POM88_001672 [Heracleum sosnowskyi]
MNIVVRIVVEKHHFSTSEESRRFQKPLKDFMHLGKMKKTAKDLDQMLERWMKEHQQERKLLSADELEQDFMHAMLPVMDSDPSAQIFETSIKATCLVILRPD